MRQNGDLGAGGAGAEERMRRARLAALALLMLPAACTGADREQARLCERTVAAFVDTPDAVVRMVTRTVEDAAHTVETRYRVAGRDTEHWIRCTFGSGAFGRDRHRLVSVATDASGTLGPVQMIWLGIALDLGSRRFLEAPDGGADGPDTAARLALYGLQQATNGLAAGSAYALLAAGFTLVYAVVGQINLAFGALLTVGGFVTVIVMTLTGAVGLAAAPAALGLALPLAMAAAALKGLAAHRTIFDPLAGRDSQAALLAGLGLAIAASGGDPSAAGR